MKTENTSRKIQWLPTLLIVWNILDIVVHVALNLVEPLRIAGNVAALVAAVVVLLGFARAYAPHVLGLAAALVVGFNFHRCESLSAGAMDTSRIIEGEFRQKRQCSDALPSALVAGNPHNARSRWGYDARWAIYCQHYRPNDTRWCVGGG